MGGKEGMNFKILTCFRLFITCPNWERATRNTNGARDSNKGGGLQSQMITLESLEGVYGLPNRVCRNWDRVRYTAWYD